MTNEKFEKVVLRLEEGDETYVETPWVVDLVGGLYRMENCPSYFYGIAVGDIIHAEYSEQEGQLAFTRVVEKSGNKLVRVIFENPANEEGPEKDVLDALVALGCTFEGASPEYICIDIPKNIDLFTVCNYLTEQEVQWEHAAPGYSELYPDK